MIVIGRSVSVVIHATIWIVAIGDSIAATAVNVSALVINATTARVIAALGKPSATSVADNSAAVRTPSFEAPSSPEVTMDCHLTPMTVATVDFTHAPAIISGNSAAMLVRNVTHWFVTYGLVTN